MSYHSRERGRDGDDYFDRSSSHRRDSRYSGGGRSYERSSWEREDRYPPKSRSHDYYDSNRNRKGGRRDSRERYPERDYYSRESEREMERIHDKRVREEDGPKEGKYSSPRSSVEAPRNIPPNSLKSVPVAPTPTPSLKELYEMRKQLIYSRIGGISRSVDVFEKLEQIGEGTYGKVYMAKNRENSEIVALKKIRMESEKEGFPITAIREIKLLRKLKHPNIVQLKEIVTAGTKGKKKGENNDGSIYMVFEYMDHDLSGIMISESKSWNPTPAQIKCYLQQILRGLQYCHENNVLHRDMKGSNLLLNNKGELKIADFGLARLYSQLSQQYTNRVITLWYRPPELLLGAEEYGPAIDIWSAGCIFAELLAGRAIFQGKSEVEQLELIFKTCGSPTAESWPSVHSLPWWEMNRPRREYPRRFHEVFENFPPDAFDLIQRMLTLDPSRRISAADALKSSYFNTPPEPSKLWELPTFESSHEYQAKKRRQPQNSEDSKRYKSSQEPTEPPYPPPPAPPPPSSRLPYPSQPSQHPPHPPSLGPPYPPPLPHSYSRPPYPPSHLYGQLPPPFPSHSYPSRLPPPPPPPSYQRYPPRHS